MNGKKAFEVVEIEIVDIDKCIVRGRAYEDIFLGDNVFVVVKEKEDENKVIEFKVQKITTYRREVPVLNGMVTGDLHLSGYKNEIIKSTSMLYKVI